jgi:hypothetical protein
VHNTSVKLSSCWIYVNNSPKSFQVIVFMRLYSSARSIQVIGFMRLYSSARSIQVIRLMQLYGSARYIQLIRFMRLYISEKSIQANCILAIIQFQKVYSTNFIHAIVTGRLWSKVKVGKLSQSIVYSTYCFWRHAGYQRQLTYKHGDGSFSAFGKRDKSGSML